MERKQLAAGSLLQHLRLSCLSAWVYNMSSGTDSGKREDLGHAAILYHQYFHVNKSKYCL